jgi:hypothetical protein
LLVRQSERFAIETAIAAPVQIESSAIGYSPAIFAIEQRVGPRPTSMVKKNQKQIPASLQPWIDARRRFHLSHEHVQMARELGMNPKKLGKLDNHEQEPWKLPLPEFIRKLYSVPIRLAQTHTICSGGDPKNQGFKEL